MNFLFPFFLIAGISIAIPILIHLFNFRKYKKVWFPDIRFLKELQEQTHKQSKLKNLLILLSRILAILSLVAAFAQPFFSKDKETVTQGPRAVSIYIDNSFSMGITKNNLSMFDLAKSKAKDIIETYSNSDEFQIVTNDFAYNENKFLSKDQALQHLSTLRLSAKSRNASIILAKQNQLLETEPGKKKQLVFISDYQKNNFPADISSNDSIKKYFVLVEPTSVNNVSIDTAYFENPSLLMNEPNNMVLRLKNNGSEPVTSSVTLNVNNQLKSVVNTSLKANETKNETISFSTSTAGNQNIEVFINDYPVSFDDTFYIAGKVTSNYNVLVLNQSNANAFLSSVFKPGVQFRMDNNNVGSMNPANLKNYSLIILNGVTNMSPALSDGITSYLNGGGSVFVLAPVSNNANDINTILSKTAGCNYGKFDTSKSYVTNYNKSHELFRDIFEKTPENIDLPIVYKHFYISNTAMTSEQKLFSFSNGDAFLSAYKVGNGKMYVCASSAELSSSNFPKSYWFLPILYKMAFSNSQNAIHAVTLGKNASLYIDNTKMNDKTTYHVSNGENDAIPEQRAMGNRMMLNLNQAVTQSGIYSIYLPGSVDSQFVGVNFDRSESKMDFWKLSDLKNSAKLKNAEWIDDKLDAASNINELQHGIPLWKLCIIFALLFLLVEILLIRFMK